MSCLFRKGENTDSKVEVRGIAICVGFHPERLEESKEKIKELLICATINTATNGQIFTKEWTNWCV
jgi:hypothetical protein